jgi:hypothetical protein
MKTYAFYTKVILLSASVLLSNCKGEEGDPGPAGATGEPGITGVTGPAGPNAASMEQAFENGFVKGTLKGTRRDGTAFEEPFEYKLAYEPEAFYTQKENTQRLDIFRTKVLDWGDDGNEPYVYLYLDVDNKGAASQTVNVSWLELYFNELQTNRNRFDLRLHTTFTPERAYFPISPAHNAKYKLVNFGRSYHNGDSGSNLVGRTTDEATNKEYFYFTDEAGNQIFFGEITGSAELYRYEYYLTPAGTKVVGSPVWYNVRFNASAYDSQAHAATSPAFFTTVSVDNTVQTGLSQEMDVPADTQSITNYNYNPVTGDLSFDYAISIQQYQPWNTTQHPLEIKGSVKTTIYDKVSMRRRFDGNNQ